MDSEFDNKPQSESTANEGAREGYTPAGGYQKNYRSNGRPQRPRINSQRAYSSERSNEGGFRPEGFGMALQQNNGEHRQGGYQQRGGYQPRQQGGYGRPQGGGYNNNRGGYQNRPQGGYRPRFNNNDEEGGYQPRQQGGYGRPQSGGRSIVELHFVGTVVHRAVATTTVVDMVVHTRQATIPMQNIISRSVLNIRRRTSILTSHCA